MHRWVPILFTWAKNLNSETHKNHFKILFEQVASKIESERIQDELIFSKMNFSKAQRAGFIAAYAELRKISLLEAEEKTTKLLIGCLEHFRASITRFSRNYGAVSLEKRNEFFDLALSLLEIDKVDSFDLIVESLMLKFPNCKKWLRWWISPEHKKLIFPAFQTHLNLKKEIPDTNNAQEEMHSIFYKQHDEKCDLFVGFTVLILFAIYLEECFLKMEKGIKTSYGEPEPWKKNCTKVWNNQENQKKNSKK